MATSLETWVRTNFWQVLSYDICRAIWHCLQGRYLLVEVKDGDRTHDDDLSGGAQFNSEILAMLLAEKEGKKFMALRQAYEQVRVNHPPLMLKDVLGPAGWIVVNPDPMKRASEPFIVAPDKEKDWPPPFLFLPDPTGDPQPIIVPGREKEADEYMDHDSRAWKEAQQVLNDAILAGKVQYRSDTFVNCAKPSANALNLVMGVIQRTVKTFGSNVKDMEMPIQSAPGK